MISAVLLLDLIKDGLLELDNPIGQYLPEICELINYERYDPIMFRQLASHTAGLLREPNNFETATAGPISNWGQNVLNAIEMTAIDTPPNQRYHYSNIDFGVLGLAASRAADIPFMNLVESQLFEPLAMTSSFFVLNPSREINLATGYANDRRVVSTELPANEHGGSVAGYSAYLVFDPAAQIGVVYLRNYNQDNSDMFQGVVGLLNTLVRDY